jgi:hypothetical protein
MVSGYDYGSQRLEIRRPPVVANLGWIGGGLLMLLLAAVGSTHNYGILREGIQDLGGLTTVSLGYNRLDEIVNLLTLALFAVIILPTILIVVVNGFLSIAHGIGYLLTPHKRANIPLDYAHYGDVRDSLMNRMVNTYKAFNDKLVNSLLSTRSLFLTPVERKIVEQNFRSLRGRLVNTLLLSGLLACTCAALYLIVRSLDIDRAIGSPEIQSLASPLVTRWIILPFALLVVLQLVLGIIEYFSSILMVPWKEPATQSSESSDHYRGFGHPAQLLSRLSIVAIPLQWEGFLNRSRPEYPENYIEKPSNAVGDVGTFSGYTLIEQQPKPVPSRSGPAAYFLMVSGWLLRLAAYYLLLFQLVTGPLRAFGALQTGINLWGPVYLILMAVAAWIVASSGTRFIEQAEKLFLICRFVAQAILIDLVGSISRADVRVGKSMADSIEASNVIARSDFTARFWAAELVSEAPSIGERRYLLAFDQNNASQEWVRYFRTEINKLRDEGVKTIGVDLEANEVSDIVRANVGVSSLRSGAMEKAQLQAAHDGSEKPLLGAQKVENSIGSWVDVPDTTTPAPDPSSGEYKECPECAELVRVKARRCRFCGHIFEE